MCNYCEYQHTMNCPNSQYCYSTEEKPCFKLAPIYKSKFTYKNKVYYSIHHFNKFQKLISKVIWRIKIEDC